MSSDTGEASHVDLWDVATRKVTQQFPVASAAVYSVAFSPDGHSVAAGAGHFLLLCDVVNHTAISVRDDGVSYQGDAEFVGYTRDGHSLLVADNRGVLKVWDVRSARFARTGSVEPPSATVVVNDAAIAPDGSLIVAAGYDENIVTTDSDNTPDPHLWLSRPGTTTAQDRDDTNEYTTVAYSPDGRLIAAGDGSGAIELWTASTFAAVGNLAAPQSQGGITSIAFSRDSRTLATGQSAGYPQKGGNIQLWSI
jgi:WD40 repeat protein